MTITLRFRDVVVRCSLLLWLCACPAGSEPAGPARASRASSAKTSGAPAAASSSAAATARRRATDHGTVKRLVHIPGSTKKLEQLIGDYDKHLRVKTNNLTKTRYRLLGTDLGSSFEHRGRLIMLFGDTVGEGGGDSIAYSTTADPGGGLALSFFRNDGGGYLRVRPDGEQMKGFEVPVGGISIDDRPYLFCKRNHTKGGDTHRTSLVSFDEQAKTFTTIRELSRRPEGKFIKIAAHHATPSVRGLPSRRPQVLLWGTGKYRGSSCYLSCIAAANIEKPGKTKYFTGLGDDGLPAWSSHEKDARPVVDHPTMADVSVTYSSELKLWLLVYDSRDPRGVLLRHAHQPWGPWSEPQLIFNMRRDDALERFIHRRDSDDGLEGPVIGKGRQSPKSVAGGAYAPYVIERFTRVEGDRLVIHYVLSTWNPYVVVLMKSALRIVR